LGSSGVLGYI